MEPLLNVLDAVNPAFVLIAGGGLGVLGTLALQSWKRRKGAKVDPLPNQITDNTLESQTARAGNDVACFDPAERDAASIRAKIDAHIDGRSAQKPHCAPPRSDHANQTERHEHQAALDHIARIIAAGAQPNKNARSNQPPQSEGQMGKGWLSRSPSPKANTGSSQKAA